MDVTRRGQDILLQAWREGTLVVIRPQDHGSGIDAASLPTLFDPFVRGNGDDKIKVPAE